MDENYLPKDTDGDDVSMINTDRAQLLALGEEFERTGGANLGKKPKQLTLSEESQKGLRELAAREAMSHLAPGPKK